VDQVMGLAAAYGRRIARGGVVVVGRDSRPTGELFLQAAAVGLRAVGCQVVEIGMVPTPTVPITVLALGAAGGIQVSASHNQVEWNALKFFSAAGRNVTQGELDAVLAAYREEPSWRTWDGVGSQRSHADATDLHRDRVLAAVDAQLIRSARLRVVIDSVNGAGSRLAPELLSRLGCEVVPLYTRPDLIFPRDPEPTAANVSLTGAVVAAAKAHIGFVQDPDADRLAIIDDQGVYIGEEYTLVLCAAARMAAVRAAGGSDEPLVACTNLSTSRMLEDVAERYGARVVRSKVGEAHVVDSMQAHGAVIGGEGNGGVIDPRVVAGRDSHIGMALVLEYLARTHSSVARLVAGIPRYAIHKEKIQMDRAAITAAIPALRNHALAQGASIDAADGLKLSWADRWVHVRASGTEPASRVIAEAPSAPEALHLAGQVRQALGAAVAGGH
jgi:phosphomannomutase